MSIAVIALLAAATPAHAYVPPSYYVIRMLARKHAPLEDARFRSKVTFYKKSGEVIASVNETLALSDAERATVKLTDASGNELALKSRKLIGARPGDVDRPVTYDLLFVKDGANIYEHLKLLGLPLKTEAALYSEKEGAMPYKPETTVALERYENKIAVVVGDRSKKSDVNSAVSLWVEKDSYLPLRAVFPTAPEMGMSSEPLELRMSSYGMHKAFLYPRNVQIFRNGTLWAKVETQEVRGGGGALEASPAKVEPDGDLRELIDTYLRWIR
ncbi:MAG: hypothetical protein HY075_16255 [Deltaproteobacteria bacterium]|nr:hypothetical protein [Deltaproteobacteria bacterium]